MKNQRQFMSRIEKVEAEHARRAEEKRHDAYERAWCVLEAGLRPDRPAPSPGRFSLCEDEILALDDRITSGTETAADAALLARMPADALETFYKGLDARRFVAIFAKGFRMF